MTYITAALLVKSASINAVWSALGGNTSAIAIDETAGTWVDHRENVGGGVIELIQKVRGGNRYDALKWLAALDGFKPMRESPGVFERAQ